MEAIVNEFSVMSGMPWQVVLVRIFGSILFCGAIGYERERRDRPAGLRTHMLIGLASTVYCLLMLELIEPPEVGYAEMVRADPIRIVEAVTSGVAFLAAGMIVFSQGKVKGLTTGASMWLAASVGLAIGLGLWGIALTATLCALVIVRLLKIAEDKAMGD